MENNDSNIIQIQLSSLYETERIGLKAAFCEVLAQCAIVCLEDQKHESGVSFTIKGDYKEDCIFLWDSADEQMIRCYSDEEVATEHGAYGIAILLINLLTGLDVVQRSKKGTGFDFWLGDKGETMPLFQGKARLEVSGIRLGSDKIVEARLKQKINQIGKMKSPLPAFVVIVEFGSPCSKVVRK